MAVRSVVVVGADCTVGRSLALGLSRAGLKVSCAGEDEPETLYAASLVDVEGGGYHPLWVDLSDAERMSEAAAYVLSSIGSLDAIVFVDNRTAPIDRAGSVEESWRATVDGQVKACVSCVRAAVARGAHPHVVLVSPNADESLPSTLAKMAGNSVRTDVLASEADGNDDVAERVLALLGA